MSSANFKKKMTINSVLQLRVLRGLNKDVEVKIVMSDLNTMQVSVSDYFLTEELVNYF